MDVMANETLACTAIVSNETSPIPMRVAAGAPVGRSLLLLSAMRERKYGVFEVHGYPTAVQFCNAFQQRRLFRPSNHEIYAYPHDAVSASQDIDIPGLAPSRQRPSASLPGTLQRGLFNRQTERLGLRRQLSHLLLRFTSFPCQRSFGRFLPVSANRHPVHQHCTLQGLFPLRRPRSDDHRTWPHDQRHGPAGHSDRIQPTDHCMRQRHRPRHPHRLEIMLRSRQPDPASTTRDRLRLSVSPLLQQRANAAVRGLRRRQPRSHPAHHANPYRPFPVWLFGSRARGYVYPDDSGQRARARTGREGSEQVPGAAAGSGDEESEQLCFVRLE